jgi:Kdo2-lipid IVA lauroyltransferase/acyltransferase
VKRILLRMGEWLGALAWAVGIRRSVALDGLRRAFPALSDPERKRIARASYQQLGRSMAELLLPAAETESAMRFEPWELYETAHAKGRGVVLAVAHFGNFELLARAAVRRGMKVSVVVRTLGDVFGRWLMAGRGRSGVHQLSERASTRGALAALRRGEVLGIIVDQNMRRSRGIFVDFFGEKACTTPAAAVFSLRSGAPLLALFPVRQPDGTHLVHMRGPFSTELSGHAAVEDLTQQLTRAVEDEVREHPDHWFWVHRRWKTRPE